MKHLSGYTQGVQGKAPKTTLQGYCSITAYKGGNTEIELSIDTFEGVGKDYKERENAIIDIYLPNVNGKRWRGTAADLKAILFPKAN